MMPPENSTYVAKRLLVLLCIVDKYDDKLLHDKKFSDDVKMKTHSIMLPVCDEYLLAQRQQIDRMLWK